MKSNSSYGQWFSNVFPRRHSYDVNHITDYYKTILWNKQNILLTYEVCPATISHKYDHYGVWLSHDDACGVLDLSNFWHSYRHMHAFILSSLRDLSSFPMRSPAWDYDSSLNTEEAGTTSTPEARAAIDGSAPCFSFINVTGPCRHLAMLKYCYTL